MQTIDLSNPVELNKLTDSILLVLNLPYKAALPYLLAEPSALNNREAIQFWLCRFLKESDWIEPYELVELCANNIKRQLLDWQESA